MLSDTDSDDIRVANEGDGHSLLDSGTDRMDGDKRPLLSIQQAIIRKGQIWKNLLLLAFIFLLENIAFSLRFLESSLNRYKGLGVLSLSCLFGTLILSCTFAPSIITATGPKTSMICGCVVFSIYTIANFYPHYGTLIPSALVTGIGLGPFLTAQGMFVTTYAVEYAEINQDDVQTTVYKFNGIFFMFLLSTPIWGNLISSLILQATKPEKHWYEPGTMNVCGPEYCLYKVDPYSNQTYATQDGVHGVRALLGIYLLCSLAGLLLTLFFLPSLRNDYGNFFDRSKVINSLKDACSSSFATFKHLTDFRMFMLVPVCIYSGVQQTLIYGTFTESYVSCRLGLQWVGYVMMCVAGSTTVFSVTLGLLVQRIGRVSIFIFGAVLNLALIVGLLAWKVKDHNLVPHFVIGGLWGIDDAIWQTQVSSLLGVLFWDKQEPAFANFRLWQAVGFTMAFAYSTHLCASTKIYVGMGLLLLSTLFYIIVEIRVRLNKNDNNSEGVDDYKLTLHFPKMASWVPNVTPYGGGGTRQSLADNTVNAMSDAIEDEQRQARERSLTKD